MSDNNNNNNNNTNYIVINGQRTSPNVTSLTLVSAEENQNDGLRLENMENQFDPINENIVDPDNLNVSTDSNISEDELDNFEAELDLDVNNNNNENIADFNLIGDNLQAQPEVLVNNIENINSNLGQQAMINAHFVNNMPGFLSRNLELLYNSVSPSNLVFGAILGIGALYIYDRYISRSTTDTRLTLREALLDGFWTWVLQQKKK